MAARRGWSVLIQGPAHHVAGTEEETARAAGAETWAPGDRELFVRIVPSRITGRRVGAVQHDSDNDEPEVTDGGVGAARIQDDWGVARTAAAASASYQVLRLSNSARA
jgi:hypothetical protein